MIDQVKRTTVAVGGGEPPEDVTDRESQVVEPSGGTILVLCIDAFAQPDGTTQHRLSQLIANGALVGQPKAIASLLRFQAEAIDPQPKIALASSLPPNGRV